jgi:hypothetical protein
MAPTAKNSNGINSDAIFAAVGAAAPTHAATLNGFYLDRYNYEGILIPVLDASTVWLAGFVANDQVRFAIIL